MTSSALHPLVGWPRSGIHDVLRGRRGAACVAPRIVGRGEQRKGTGRALAPDVIPGRGKFFKPRVAAAATSASEAQNGFSIPFRARLRVVRLRLAARWLHTGPRMFRPPERPVGSRRLRGTNTIGGSIQAVVCRRTVRLATRRGINRPTTPTERRTVRNQSRSEGRQGSSAGAWT